MAFDILLRGGLLDRRHRRPRPGRRTSAISGDRVVAIGDLGDRRRRRRDRHRRRRARRRPRVRRSARALGRLRAPRRRARQPPGPGLHDPAVGQLRVHVRADEPRRPRRCSTPTSRARARSVLDDVRRVPRRRRGAAARAERRVPRRSRHRPQRRRGTGRPRARRRGAGGDGPRMSTRRSMRARSACRAASSTPRASTPRPTRSPRSSPRSPGATACTPPTCATSRPACSTRSTRRSRRPGRRANWPGGRCGSRSRTSRRARGRCGGRRTRWSIVWSAARRDGIDAAADQYPYTAAATTLATVLPPAILALSIADEVVAIRDPAPGRAIRDEQARGRLGLGERDPRIRAGPAIVIAHSDSRPEWAGRSIADLAADARRRPRRPRARRPRRRPPLGRHRHPLHGRAGRRDDHARALDRGLHRRRGPPPGPPDPGRGRSASADLRIDGARARRVRADARASSTSRRRSRS